ncbi:MAG: carbohydrate ABC transporter permease [Caldilineaceae bacterium]|nr:carbohydrate ABC transporter permease [Caldilineaceae bacterium]
MVSKHCRCGGGLHPGNGAVGGHGFLFLRPISLPGTGLALLHHPGDDDAARSGDPGAPVYPLLQTGLDDTIQPLWVPHWFGGGAFFIFLMRQFFMSLPRELDEAAIIDGANRLQIFFRILLPLTKPALATMTVISFMSGWSDFLGPLIYLNSPQKFTLAVGLQYFNAVEDAGFEPTQHLLMTACVLTVVPTLIVFFSTQKYFVRGIVMTGDQGVIGRPLVRSYSCSIESMQYQSMC